MTTEGGSSTAVFNPDIRQPRIDEATVHVEREVSDFLLRPRRLCLQARVESVPAAEHGPSLLRLQQPDRQRRSGPRRRRRHRRTTAARSPTTTSTLPTPAAFERLTYVNVPGKHRPLPQYRGRRGQAAVPPLAAARLVSGDPRTCGSRGSPLTPNEEFFPKNEMWDQPFRLSGSYERHSGFNSAALRIPERHPAGARRALPRPAPVQHR